MNGSMIAARHMGRKAAKSYLLRCEQEQQRKRDGRRKTIQGFVLMGTMLVTAILAFTLPG